MRILTIAAKDLYEIVQDWKTPLFLLIMPVFFTIFMGLVFKPTAEDSRLPVGVLAESEDEPAAEQLTALLELSEAVRPVPLDAGPRNEVEDRIASEELAGAIVLPVGALQAPDGSAPVQPYLLLDPNSETATVVQNEVEVAVLRHAGAARAAQSALEVYEQQAQFADQSAREAYYHASLERALAAWASPPLSLEETAEIPFAGGGEGALEPEQYSFAQSSPSMIIQFGIAGLLGSATLLVNERKHKSLARLLTTATRRSEIIAGKLLAYFLIIAVQIFVLALFGRIIYGLPYFREPLALLAVGGSFALVLATMGLLVGSIARTDEAAVILVMVPMFVLSALGGAWMPLELFPRNVKTVAHIVTPTAWALEAFQDIIMRGQGLGAVLPASGVMMLWAIVLFALAIWRLKFVE